jgi:dihydroorotate dehydrogenase
MRFLKIKAFFRLSAVQVGTWNFTNPKITIDIIEGLQNDLTANKTGVFREFIGTLL